MTLSPDQTYGPARQREHDLMSQLARVVRGEALAIETLSQEETRQLGYAAHLARGRVTDPEDNLGRFSRACLDRVRDLPRQDLAYRDPVQARWGATHSLDPRKLRTELPLHLERARRRGA
jgi:hypothetical protein